jgi:hypothetical protein
MRAYRRKQFCFVRQNNKKKLMNTTYIASDCLLLIFEYCDAQVVKYSLPLVNKTWNTIIQQYEQHLWKTHCHYEFPMLKHVMSPTITTNWKYIYMEQAVLIPYKVIVKNHLQCIKNLQGSELIAVTNAIHKKLTLKRK